MSELTVRDRIDSILVLAAVLVSVALPSARQRPAEAVRQERERATREAPQLAQALALKPGMVVADIGAGGGAMSVAMAKWLGPQGRVYATDVGAEQLAEIKAYVTQEAATNVVVLQGAESSTNLPSECCDAIFLRDVYHHLTRPQEFNVSLLATLRRGGRLAVLDFEADQGSKIPPGVPGDRGGHGIPASILVAEVTAAGFRHVTTMAHWPPDEARSRLFLEMFEKP